MENRRGRVDTQPMTTVICTAKLPTSIDAAIAEAMDALYRPTPRDRRFDTPPVARRRFRPERAEGTR